MSVISDLKDFVDRNEGFCMLATFASTVAIVILGCVYMSLKNTREMAEKGYVEVPHMSISGTHWEKAK